MLRAAMLGDGTRKPKAGVYYSKDRALAEEGELTISQLHRFPEPRLSRHRLPAVRDNYSRVTRESSSPARIGT